MMRVRRKRMSTIARAIRVWWNVDFISGLSRIKMAPLSFLTFILTFIIYQDGTFSISYIIPLNLFVDCQFSWTNKETFCIPMLPSIPIDPTIGSATWARGCSFHKAIEGSTVLIMDLVYINFNLIK